MRLSLLAGEGMRLMGDGGVEIAGLCADSRQLRPGELFAALGGSRDDGRRYLADALDPAKTVALLERVDEQFPAYLSRAEATPDERALGYRQSEVGDALAATQAALALYRQTGDVRNDATANALRAVVATRLPSEPLVGEAAGILQPAEARGGQVSFRYIAPAAIVLVIVFGVMYVQDRRRGGYRAVRLER